LKRRLFGSLEAHVELLHIVIYQSYFIVTHEPKPYHQTCSKSRIEFMVSCAEV
jgi:hypothetical protein